MSRPPARDNSNEVNAARRGTEFNVSIENCCAFPQWLVSQEPFYDELIIADITPTDSWIGNVATGTFPSATGVEHRLDKFRTVWPNTTKAWARTQYAGCVGTPCDKTEYTIGWGSDQITYFLEEQSWNTPLVCYDQLMHVSHAMEQFEQIISDILRPATEAIQSSFLRKRLLFHAGRKLTANSAMTPFTYVFTAVGTDEVFFDCSVHPNSVFLLTPQMLQRWFSPLMREGYAGKNPFKETLPFIELVTDIDTCWNLDHLGGSVGVGGVPSITGNWRFAQFDAANNYWRYGFSGQLGNYLVRVDEFGLRFNFVLDLGAGAAPNRYRYQVLLPYENEVTGGANGDPGLGREVNDAFDGSNFAISFITHKRAITALMADSRPINPEMPFSSRNWAGRWQFVMDNLGADVSGNVIENKRRNKGQWIADFKQAIRPEYPKFAIAWFHRRSPHCVVNVGPCEQQSGYPSQSYSSEPEPCPEV